MLHACAACVCREHRNATCTVSDRGHAALRWEAIVMAVILICTSLRQSDDSRLAGFGFGFDFKSQVRIRFVSWAQKPDLVRFQYPGTEFGSVCAPPRPDSVRMAFPGFGFGAEAGSVRIPHPDPGLANYNEPA